MSQSKTEEPEGSLAHDSPLFPRGASILLTTAAAIIVVGGIRAFGDTIGPIFLALVIVVVISPLQNRLRAAGAPPWLSFLMMLIACFGVVFAIVASVAWSGVEMVGLVTSDRYAADLAATQDQLFTWAEGFGISSQDISDLVSNVDIGAVASQITSALSGVLGLFSTATLMLLTMFFMVADSNGFTRALLYAKSSKPTFVDGLRGFAQRTRSYFIVSTVFGLIVAVIDVVILIAFGIPLALVWGLLSLITNYIPNVGFVIGLAPPALLAYFEGGWSTFAWVVGLYIVANVVIQSVIQPRFVGDAVGLSTTLTFLSLIFWSWVIGPLGALLAVPMTLLAKALLVDIDPAAAWAEPLISLQGRMTDKQPGEVPEDELRDDAVRVDTVAADQPASSSEPAK